MFYALCDENLSICDWCLTHIISINETHAYKCYFTYFREELEWLFQEGVSFMFPDKWEKFLEPIPEVERGDLLSAYHRRYALL